MQEISAYKKRKIKKKLQIIADELQSLFPNAKTELKYESNFQLLIAILMSAQTTDIQVNKANDIFFQVLKEPKDGVELGVEKIKSYINTIGFFNNKAKNIYKTCKKLVEYDNKIPNTLEELVKLPGVGVKTAKVFLSVTEDAEHLGVDTHVHRVLNRFGVVKTKTPLETDTVISKINFDGSYKNLHNTLILFGRYYSKAHEDDFSKSKDPDFLYALKEKLDAVK